MIVFTNGCFDILHRGHLELLRYCLHVSCPQNHPAPWLLECKVVVGLNSDDSVKRLKGKNRPINNQDDRKFLLESLTFVDEVIIFNEDSPIRLIKEVGPDLIVKGGDYTAEEVVGHDLCKVKIFDLVKEYSTTNTLENLPTGVYEGGHY